MQILNSIYMYFQIASLEQKALIEKKDPLRIGYLKYNTKFIQVDIVEKTYR